MLKEGHRNIEGARDIESWYTYNVNTVDTLCLFKGWGS